MNSKNCREYKLSKNRYKELYYFCQQYSEWKDMLKCSNHTVKSVVLSGMPGSHSFKDQTSELAEKRVGWQEKIDLVEATAEEADPILKNFIIKAVTNDGVTYTYLSQRMEIPCGKNMYYEKRRKFYWLLDKKLK
ncbi:MAG: hypothetical protein HFG38_11140 [Eubacterium sp.]|jgi:hypothetical protein|nr:hypothetical protein [Eubacterium sp.]